MENDILSVIKQAIIDGDDELAHEKTQEALDSGMDPLEVVKNSVQTAMDYVGNQYQEGELYLPELVIAGDAAKSAMDLLMKKLDEIGDKSVNKGTIVLGVVYGDNHDIGKNLVMAILSAYGFKVIDLGVNCHPKQFIDTAVKENANIIAMSTLITTSMPYQQQVINNLEAMGLRDKFYCIVGGGPITAEWTEKIKADGYGRDAKDAVSVCEKLVTSGVVPPLEKPMIEGALKAQ